MTCTSYTGAATGSGSLAYARYLIKSALKQENERAALYYAGVKVEGRDYPETAVQIRADASPAMAKRLGIDTTRQLTLTEMANLMNNKRADGHAIEGKKKHSEHQSVASVFGLDKTELPTVVAIENVLSGKRADGEAPRANAGNGAPLPEMRIESSLRAFKAAIGVRGDRNATPEEIARVAEGKIDVADFLRQINATAPAVGYEDLTFSADKSVSICYALAPTAAERAIILAAVHGATDDAMAYAETVLGIGRRGAGGQGEAEKGEIFWIAVQHYTSRPAVDFVRLDADGQEFTDIREVPMAKSDPNLHQHRIIPSSVLTKSGRVGSLDLSRLKGEQKVMGAVFHAALATRLEKAGIRTETGPSGEARISGIPDWVRKFHSRRSTQGERSAREMAAAKGQSWDSLDGEQKAALVSECVAKERQAKKDEPRRPNDEGPAEIPIWRRDAKEAGYRHRSVLRPGAARRTLTHEQRIQIAREASLPLLEKAYETRAVLSGGEVREIAARGLIVSGIGQRPADDIEAVCKTYREQGVKVRGEWTHLEWGIDYGENGKKQTVVTTGHTLEQETRLTRLVQSAAADKTGALTPEQIDRAAERFLARHPKIDRNGAQWQAQLAMAHEIGEGGRFSFSIGVAGSGKSSSVVAVLIDAWHAEGKTVYGMTVPWKASTALRDAGADQSLAIAAFLSRVEKGKIKIDANTVIVADEVSMVGVTQQLALAEVAKRFGARLAEIGDPRQCQAVETPAIDLIARAIGDENIPKLLTSIRQQTERGREVAAMFRDGRAAEGLSAMQDDGRMHLVAGNTEQVFRHTTALWREMTDANKADPDYSLIVMTPTNEQARSVGAALRQDRRAAGEIGRAETTVRARDPNSKETFDLALSVGDKIRTFTRTYDADVGPKKRLSNNGDVVEIKENSARRATRAECGRRRGQGALGTTAAMARSEERPGAHHIWIRHHGGHSSVANRDCRHIRDAGRFQAGDRLQGLYRAVASCGRRAPCHFGQLRAKGHRSQTDARGGSAPDKTGCDSKRRGQLEPFPGEITGDRNPAAGCRHPSWDGRTTAPQCRDAGTDGRHERGPTPATGPRAGSGIPRDPTARHGCGSPRSASHCWPW